MTLFKRYFSGDASGNGNHLLAMDASATAGCSVRHVVSQTNFTFPFGGFGYFLSKASIQRLIEPIHCNGTSESPSDMCQQIQKNLFQEARLFQSGMRVGELMYRFTASEPYIKHKTWKTGFCVHSDW